MTRFSHLSRFSTAVAGRVALFTVALGCAVPVVAQEGSRPTDEARNSQASRAELDSLATLAELAARNAGSNTSLRTRKQAEADMLRSRLRDGDFNVGDRIFVEIRGGQQPFVDTVTVGTGRVVRLPDMPDISLAGVLRSELQDHLTRELGRYVRNPDIRARTFIRVALLGAIGKAGFYTFPADILFTDALMQAGGPREDTNLENVEVRRSEKVVLGREDSQRAIREGWTLDQMSLRAGDEVVVGKERDIDWWRVFRIASLALSTGFLIARVADRLKD